ncbi:MAG: SH3 domain-containing protein [Pseudomonadota bacterium]
MARFMVVTFLLLGWGFFELSGGTDFEPPELEAKPLNALLEEVADEERSLVARAKAAPATTVILGEPEAPAAAEPITLASFGDTQSSLVTLLSDAAVSRQPTPEEVVVAPVDLRSVSGSRVNMRNGPGTQYQVLAQLVRGDEAEVLQDPGAGWVKIRVAKTGRVGWMAASLLRPVN